MKMRKIVIYGMAAAVLITALYYVGLYALEIPSIDHPTDLSDQSWISAFEKMHTELGAKYAFTEWKGINWDNLYARFHPRIETAEANNDKRAFYLALREYAHSIPDGHIELEGDDLGLKREQIGGSYGFAVTQLDDDSFIVSALLKDGAAAQAGIKVGAEIVSLDNTPIQEAVSQVSVLWYKDSLATIQSYQLTQARFLTYAPLGTEKTVTFMNPGEDEKTMVSLRAQDDGEQLYGLVDPTRHIDKEGKDWLTYEILPDGYGYMKIDLISPSFMDEYEEAIRLFSARDVPAIIFDMRSNWGGDSETVLEMMSYFHTEKMCYETTMYHFGAGIGFAEPPGEKEFIKPNSLQYDGQLVVLVSDGTYSAGESIALLIQNLPQGQTVGFYNTPGMGGRITGYDGVGGMIYLPEGYAIQYPTGRRLDCDGNIYIEPGADGIGGVTPDIRVPLTLDNIIATSQEVNVELEYAIQLLRQQTTAQSDNS